MFEVQSRSLKHGISNTFAEENEIQRRTNTVAYQGHGVDCCLLRVPCRVARDIAQRQDSRSCRVANCYVISDDLADGVRRRPVPGKASHQRNAEEAEAHGCNGGKHAEASPLCQIREAEVANNLHHSCRHGDDEGGIGVEAHATDQLGEEYGDASTWNINGDQEEENQVRLQALAGHVSL